MTTVKKEKQTRLDVITLKKIKEESNRVRAILKANKLQPEVNGFGDYKTTLVKSGGIPILNIDFKNKDIARNIASVLKQNYGYKSTIHDKIIEVALLIQSEEKISTKDIHTNSVVTVKKSRGRQVGWRKPKPEESKNVEPAVEKISSASINSGSMIDYVKIRAERDIADANTLEELRARAKRIVGLIRHKFNLTNVRGDKSGGYNSGRIHDVKTRGYWMGFKTEELAKKVTAFLESENYSVVLNGREITIDIIKTPEETKLKKHEETSLGKKQVDIIGELNSALEKARTAHLTTKQIGERIWDYMTQNNFHVVDGSRKITVTELCSGVNILNDLDKDFFVNLVVTEALK